MCATTESKRLSLKNRGVGLVVETEGHFSPQHFIMKIFKHTAKFEEFSDEIHLDSIITLLIIHLSCLYSSTHLIVY